MSRNPVFVCIYIYIYTLYIYVEYCETEIFEASCSDTEVVYMTRALYGRMRIGRCISMDLGFAGCWVDVLPLADRQCSGRPSCRIRMPNSAFDELRRCPLELRNYLEAGYECIKGMTYMFSDICNMLKYFIFDHPIYIHALTHAHAYIYIHT